MIMTHLVVIVPQIVRNLEIKLEKENKKLKVGEDHVTVTIHGMCSYSILGGVFVTGT